MSRMGLLMRKMGLLVRKMGLEMHKLGLLMRKIGLYSGGAGGASVCLQCCGKECHLSQDC